MKFKQRFSLKVFMAFCFIVSCIFAGVEPRNAEAALTDGLVAYYPFNGNANDTSGNNIHATNYGAQLTNSNNGSENSAFLFDGNNDYIYATSSKFSVQENITVSAWINNTDILFTDTYGNYIINKGVQHSDPWSDYHMTLDATGKVYFSIVNTEGTRFSAVSGKSITNGFHHVVGVYSYQNSKISIYVDGTLAGEAVASGKIRITDHKFYIGDWNGNSTWHFWKGSIDDVRIYNRALSASEIQTLYTEGQTPSNLVLSVSPASSSVSSSAGTTSFAVSNTGTGTMNWTAAVTSGTWLKITSGSSGSNSGTINCSFDANTTTSARTGTIRVTATGATGSPKDITVTQAAGGSPVKPSLTLSSASGSPSGTVTVNLSLTNVTGVNVAAISTDIDFDSSIFEAYPSDAANTKNPAAVIGAAGTAAGKRVIYNLVDSNTLRVGIYSENTTAIANGVVASITFYIKSTAINGLTTDLTQIPSGSDSNSNDVTITGTKGTVTINSCKLGDCDCNGTVSIAEVQSAVNMYLGKKTVASCCDRDGNGSVSISEVQAIVNNYLGIVPKSKHATRDKKQPAQVNVDRADDGCSLSLIPNKNSISAMSIDAAYPVELAGKISFSLGASAELAGKELVQNQIQPGITRIGLIDAFDNQSIDDGEILFVHVDGDSAEGDVIFKVTASDEAGGEIQVR